MRKLWQRARVRQAAAHTHHENVARLRALSAVAKELEQVVELAVDVAADGDRALNRVHRALLEHQLLHVLAKVLEVVLWQ